MMQTVGHDREKAQVKIANAQLRGTLNKLLDAWDALPEGRYTPSEIERWLKNQIHPVIREARTVLGREPPTSSSGSVQSSHKCDLAHQSDPPSS